MTQGLDRGTLDRLIALGRSRGAITADDLHTALPVERMDVDALVLVMLELEAAGVSVEPEAVGPPANRPVSTAVELPAPKPGTPPDRATEAGYGAAFAAPGSAAAAPPEPIPDDRADASRAVILAGLATVLILGAVLLML
ncbi:MULTISPECIES: RNA polymerase sigma factor region1.1 domain-containing protein [unclassified Methylobacterium]|uniref:RNA polymerase sigma factor region1.1 domain-containing protein n=1 Tax=unclassified Methylobacterium TaxID=2615210 RepID=UPI0005BAD2E6|nr:MULTISPECIES: RNA polymerase sigma factor region1.1 domain-containing protein [unclassified Methylobacterium]SFU74470.1 Sigma-70 factor, region 1.1 [Methylobacterium sp. UNCCL125]